MWKGNLFFLSGRNSAKKKMMKTKKNMKNGNRKGAGPKTDDKSIICDPTIAPTEQIKS